MGQDPPPLSHPSIDTDHDSQSAGALQLFPCRWEYNVVMDILQGGGQIALQVVESKESEAQPDLGRD